MKLRVRESATFAAAFAQFEKSTSKPTSRNGQAVSPLHYQAGTPILADSSPASPTNNQTYTSYDGFSSASNLSVSPSYSPVSPPSSPQPISESSAHVGRPTFPSTSKTYATALKGLNSAAAEANTAGSSGAHGGSVTNKRSGMKVFCKPSYAKKPAETRSVNNGTFTIETSKLPTDVNVAKGRECTTSDAPVTPEKNAGNVHQSSSPGSGIRLRINFTPNAERITIIKSGQGDSSVLRSTEKDSAARKRTVAEALADDSDFTDSDIDINPLPRKKKALPPVLKKTKAAVNPKKTKKPVATNTKKKSAAKKTKVTATKTDNDGDSLMSEADSSLSVNDLILVQPRMKRKDRIVDPTNPVDAVLIAAATKAGADIYDSDLEDLPNSELKGTKQQHLFRNVNWGPAASDLADEHSFPTNPVFTQFVPGRWERQPDGTVTDQKHKLLVKLTDNSGNKRIFKNPPPADWTNQDAITILNKRTVQQIRRSTVVRFRQVVTPYVQEERQWILANLHNGKPTTGWGPFVDAFNNKFHDKVVAGSAKPRPKRTQSSLTKEVERFGAEFYSKGLVPSPARAK